MNDLKPTLDPHWPVLSEGFALVDDTSLIILDGDGAA